MRDQNNILLTVWCLSIVALNVSMHSCTERYDEDVWTRPQPPKVQTLDEILEGMGVSINDEAAIDYDPGPLAYTRVQGFLKPTLAGRHDPTLVAIVHNAKVLDHEGAVLGSVARFGDGRFTIEVPRDIVGPEITLRVDLPHWGDFLEIKKKVSKQSSDTIDFGEIDLAVDSFWPQKKYAYLRGEFSHPHAKDANLDGMDVDVYPTSKEWRVVNWEEVGEAYMSESGVFWIVQNRAELLRNGYYLSDAGFSKIGYSFSEDRKEAMTIKSKKEGYFELTQVEYPGALFNLDIAIELPAPLRWSDQPKTKNRTKALPSDFHKYLKPGFSRWFDPNQATSAGAAAWCDAKYIGEGLWRSQFFGTQTSITYAPQIDPSSRSLLGGRQQQTTISLEEKARSSTTRVEFELEPFVALRGHGSKGKLVEDLEVKTTYSQSSTLNLYKEPSFSELRFKFPQPKPPVYHFLNLGYINSNNIAIVYTQSLRALAYDRFTAGAAAVSLDKVWETGRPPLGNPETPFVEVEISRGNAEFPDETEFLLYSQRRSEGGPNWAPAVYPFRFGDKKKVVLHLDGLRNTSVLDCHVEEPSGRVGFAKRCVSDRITIEINEEGGAGTLSLVDEAPYPTSNEREYTYRVRSGKHLIHPQFEFYRGGGYREVEGAFHSKHFIDRLDTVRRISEEQGKGIPQQEFERKSATEFEMSFPPNLEVRYSKAFLDAYKVKGLSLSWARVYVPEEVERLKVFEVEGTKRIYCGIWYAGDRTSAHADITWKDGKGLAVFDEPPQIAVVKGENYSMRWHLYTKDLREVAVYLCAGHIAKVEPGKYIWVGKKDRSTLFRSAPFEIGSDRVTEITIPTLEVTKAHKKDYSKSSD